MCACVLCEHYVRQHPLMGTLILARVILTITSLDSVLSSECCLVTSLNMYHSASAVAFKENTTNFYLLQDGPNRLVTSQHAATALSIGPSFDSYVPAHDH